jgi:hypothetical protein
MYGIASGIGTVLEGGNREEESRFMSCNHRSQNCPRTGLSHRQHSCNAIICIWQEAQCAKGGSFDM